MKKRIVLLLLLLIIPLGFVKAGSIKVTSSVTVEPNKTRSIKVTASQAAGRIDISSSNTSIVTVSPSNAFLDNSSATIKITGKKEGTATISIKLTDVGAYDTGKPITGTKTIKVTVKKAEPKKETPKEPVKPVEKVMTISSIEVVGYEIPFSKDTFVYDVDIDKNVKKVYVAADGENFNAKGTGIVNIFGVDSFDIIFTNPTKASDVVKYTINLHRIKESTAEPEVVEKEVIKEVEKKSSGVSKNFMYATFALGALCLALLLILFRKKNPDDDSDKKTIQSPIQIVKKEETPVVQEPEPVAQPTQDVKPAQPAEQEQDPLAIFKN